MKKVHIYTDGACLGNPGSGGWAAILLLPDTAHRKEISGGFRLTTNNRMEIWAAIEGLKALKRQCDVEIYTDSQYLGNAIGKGWLQAWRARGWRRKSGRAVPNADLWRSLLAELKKHSVRFVWVRGHSGQPENERCDFLARQAAAHVSLPIDAGYESRGEERNSNGI